MPVNDRNDYLAMTDRIVRVLEEFQTVIGLVKDNTNDIEALSLRQTETEKKAFALFRSVFEGTDSLVVQVQWLKQSLLELQGDTERHAQEDQRQHVAVGPVVSWYENNRDELKTLLGSLDWIANQRERERIGTVEPFHKRIGGWIALLGGAAGLISLVLNNMNHGAH